MKIFKHNGKGHYIGSTIIVVAENIEEATELIDIELINAGLPNEPINITEMEIKNGLIVLNDNGDY